MPKGLYHSTVRAVAMHRYIYYSHSEYALASYPLLSIISNYKFNNQQLFMIPDSLTRE